MLYLNQADRHPTARSELENVCAQAMERAKKPLMVAVTPATFECVLSLDWDEVHDEMRRLFIAELKGKNAPPT